jgi:hypothetical protein
MYHWTREVIAAEIIKFVHIDTTESCADIKAAIAILPSLVWMRSLRATDHG